MKNKILFVCMISAIMYILYSCNDFLDQEPKSSISPGKYLVEESQLEAYINGLYQKILRKGTSAYDDIPVAEDVHTDNQAHLNYSNKYVPGEWKVSQTDGSNWSFGNIYDCNYFFENVLPRYDAGTLTGSINNIRHYIGEVYFLRAYEYFKRYQILGDFPIVDKTLPDEIGALKEASKRMPRNTVARFILSDLNKSIELMATSPDSRKTRINKEAALLLKSRVALYEGTFLKYFKGTAFVPNGTGWPGAGKDYNKNYVFPTGNIDNEINWFLEQAIDASQLVAVTVALTENTGNVPQNLSDPVNPYMEMFGSTNLSGYKEVLMWREYSQSLKVINFNVLSAQSGNMSAGTTRGMTECFLMENGLPIYASGSGYHGDDYIADVRANRDSRLFLFLKEPGQKNILYNNPIGTGAWPIEPVPNIIGKLGSYVSRIYTTGYALRKGNSWDQAQAVDEAAGGSSTGRIYFRGVEALLNYIEAYYERYGSLNATSIQYWQKIRIRAKIDTDIYKTISATQMSKEAPNDWGAYSAGKLIDPTLYNIRRERRCEFIGEGMRWLDLQRWRSLDQMITTPYHVEGIKIWGPMQDWYKNTDGSSALKYGLDISGALVSPPDRSKYLRPYEIQRKSLVLDGYRWKMAHYLSPIAIQDMLITSQGNDVSSSPIYQNPGWPIIVGEGAIE